jgi:Na+-transporting methylmalonyl-CoA/oxaloacetate decarboxylase gamma subunit
MTFLMFILVLLFVIWFVGLVARSLLAGWMRRRTEEYNRAAKEAQKEARRQARGRGMGEIRVEATREAFQKKVSRNVGDYVEFEEITTETYEETDKK